jgi:hydrogenase maturation protease
MEKSLVLGLGNPFRGDDGVGTSVIAALKGQDQPPNVVVMDGGTPGLETVLIWQGYQRVIIVDAADMGMQPGSWKRFKLGEAVFPVGESAMQGTLHSAGLAEALALAEALEIMPPELVFYGVQPASTGWSADLTEAVNAAVPALCEAISAEIADVKRH